MTCNPHVFDTSPPLFPLFPLHGIPFPLVCAQRAPISLLDSDQASGHNLLQDGFTDPATLTFLVGHSFYHTLPSPSIYLSVFYNERLAP